MLGIGLALDTCSSSVCRKEAAMIAMPVYRRPVFQARGLGTCQEWFSWQEDSNPVGGEKGWGWRSQQKPDQVRPGDQREEWGLHLEDSGIFEGF